MENSGASAEGSARAVLRRRCWAAAWDEGKHVEEIANRKDRN